MSNKNKCPKCDSSAPHLHPAVQFEGEVSPCDDEFHRRITPQNSAKQIQEIERYFMARDEEAAR